MRRHARAGSLHDLVNHTEHVCRELREHLRHDLHTNVAEFHKLTRPQRSKGNYPTIRTVHHTLSLVETSHERARKLGAELGDYFRKIEDRLRS